MGSLPICFCLLFFLQAIDLLLLLLLLYMQVLSGSCCTCAAD
jgi:hypothetical protein